MLVPSRPVPLIAPLASAWQVFPSSPFHLPASRSGKERAPNPSPRPRRGREPDGDSRPGGAATVLWNIHSPTSDLGHIPLRPTLVRPGSRRRTSFVSPWPDFKRCINLPFRIVDRECRRSLAFQLRRMVWVTGRRHPMARSRLWGRTMVRLHERYHSKPPHCRDRIDPNRRRIVARCVRWWRVRFRRRTVLRIDGGTALNGRSSAWQALRTETATTLPHPTAASSRSVTHGSWGRWGAPHKPAGCRNGDRFKYRRILARRW